MKIAVVGAGVSGATVIKTLIDHKNFNIKDQIDVYEVRERLGVGLPYDSDDEAVMLNLSPKGLSVNSENPNDFVEWLNKNYEEPTNFEGLVSRPRYGKYLEEHFAPYFSHQQVTHKQAEVIDIKVVNKEQKSKIQTDTPYSYQIKTTNGWIDTVYDVVFFAVGHPSYADYYNLNGTENYIHNPYPMKEKLSNFDGNEKIGVIGSGATGVDLMRYFNTHYQLKNPLTYYVQDEIFYFADIPYEKDDFQFSFSNKWITDTKNKSNGFIPLDTIIETFINDIDYEGVDLIEIFNRYEKDNLASVRKALESNDQELALVHAYVAKLIQFLPALFNALSGDDKDRYLQKYYKKLIFFKARVPNKSFKWLLKLLDEGKIRIVEGLSKIESKDDGTFFISANKNEKADILINATGFDTVLTNVAEKSKLIKNLYKQEFILPHKNGRFILIKWPQAQIVNQRYGLMENVFFFGNLIGGTQHENNDAQLTIKQAGYSATWWMDHSK